jgi:hypothetical protein
VLNFINYLVRYNDFPKGTYLADKKKVFDAMGEELKAKGAILKKSQKIFADGVEGREIYFTIKDYNCKAQYFARGNRIYLFLKQNLDGGNADDGFDFFKTLKFTPQMQAVLTPYTINDNFKAATFEKIKVTADTVNTYASYLQASKSVFSTNPFTGGVFGFEHAKISKYYRAPSPDSLFRTLRTQFVTYADTLLKDDSLTINGIHGHEYISQNKSSKTKLRNRIFIDNDDVFYFVSHIDEEELFTPAANQFYNSLVKTGSTAPIALSSSKAALITTDLLSADSTTYQYALGALSYYKFEKNELPYLLSAVTKDYADDTTGHGAREALIKAITTLKDTGSIETLVKVYNTTSANNVKADILNTIADIDRKKGYDIYLDLLTKQSTSLGKEASYRIFSPMYDSIEYVAANYNRILPLMKYPEYRRSVLSITGRLFDKDYKDKYLPLVKENFNEITRYADADLNSYLKDTSDNRWRYGIYNYLQLMNHIKGQPLTEKFTTALIKNDKSRDQLSDAVITRIHNNLIISPYCLTVCLIALLYNTIY